MYATLLQTYDGAQTAGDVTSIVRGCLNCPIDRVCLRKQASPPIVLLAFKLLNSVPTDILG